MDERSGLSAFQRIALVFGPAAALAMLSLPTPAGMSIEGQRAAAVAFLMVVWWISEAIPLAATSLLPIALFPLLGVLPGTEVTLAYGDANIYLFAGGFFIAMAMQRWGLHERIALNIVLRAGANLSRLILGFMAATAFLSMWISNTATTLMMLPIGMAVADHVAERLPGKGGRGFAACLLLGTAYASSIGGIATLIGTPPNIVLASQLAKLYPEAPPIGFLQWMALGFPFAALFLPIVWWLMTRALFHIPRTAAPEGADAVAGRLAELGPMKRGEIIVAIVSLITTFAWIFRQDIQLGAFTIPGWSSIFPNPEYIHDGTVAMFFAVLLFVLPVDLKRGEFALNWDWAKRIPWGVLLLFGGGLALAQAFKETGLVAWIGASLEHLAVLPPFLVIACIALLLTFLTELTSNTATTAIMMPILGGAAAPAMGINPLLLMIPGAISASCAFMLPVATPPNAIVFGSGRISIAQMARTGLLINLVGAILVTLFTYYLAVPVFHISQGVLPDWAAP